MYSVTLSIPAVIAKVLSKANYATIILILLDHSKQYAVVANEVFHFYFQTTLEKFGHHMNHYNTVPRDQNWKQFKQTKRWIFQVTGTIVE